MNQLPLPRPSALDLALAALRDDICRPEGPQISTMRSYRFAIVPYHPRQEFQLRRGSQRLVSELSAHGWTVLPISLQALLIKRLRALGEDVLERMAEREQDAAEISTARALGYLAEKLAPHIDGADGIAADVCREIADFVTHNPDKAERTIVLVGRAGALYPFFRTSALLRYIDGRTGGVPVILFYPGCREGDNGLSFMCRLKPDRDYRPRIYSAS